MFTGIIEAVGKVVEVKMEGTNMKLSVSSPISAELKIDQSVSHNGVCLTVVNVYDDTHSVVLIQETLDKTNFHSIQKGDIVNLERCLKMEGRIDGHLVQGHIDTTAICTDKKDKQGSWGYVFKFNPLYAGLVIEKGSVCIQGVSLTCFNVTNDSFEVAIIPYTYEQTNFNSIQVGRQVNIEFDILGKYIQRMFSLNNAK